MLKIGTLNVLVHCIFFFLKQIMFNLLSCFQYQEEKFSSNDPKKPFPRYPLWRSGFSLRQASFPQPQEPTDPASATGDVLLER